MVKDNKLIESKKCNKRELDGNDSIDLKFVKKAEATHSEKKTDSKDRRHVYERLSDPSLSDFLLNKDDIIGRITWLLNSGDMSHNFRSENEKITRLDKFFTSRFILERSNSYLFSKESIKV